MAARLVNSLLRRNTLNYLTFSNKIVRKTRHIDLKTNIAGVNAFEVRRFASKSPDQNPKQDEEEDEVRKDNFGGAVITLGPLGWLSKKVNMFLLKAYFDTEFNEEEFLRGAKQALIVTSKILAERRFEDMTKICPKSFIDIIKKAVQTKDTGPAIKAVNIITAKIKDIGFQYTEEQIKIIEIDVVYICEPEQEAGNVQTMHLKYPRIIHYRFQRFCHPDKKHWFVVGIDL